MPFKHNAARRHRITNARYRVRNWRAYEAGLMRRGDLTLWLDEAAIAGWQAPPRTTPGGQARYSDVAIELVLMLRLVFHLALRQAEGFARSALRLLGQELRVPDHTTLSRRSRGFAGRQPSASPCGPMHLVIDSTGLKLFGRGAWDQEKHGRARRSWRKLHPASLTDSRPLAGSDRGDPLGLGVEPEPCFGAGIDDRLVGIEHAVAELVAAQVGPDVLERVQLGAVRRQVQQGDVVGHAQPAAGPVPSGAVDGQHGMGARGDVGADLGQVQVHHVGVGERQHERGASAAGWADRAEQVGPGIALVPRRRRPGAALGPHPGQRALLADAGLVLPPEFQRLAAGALRQRRVYEGGEVALKDAWAAASWPGCRGRATSRRKPSRRSTVLMLRSASTIPNLASIARARSARRQRTTPCSAKSGPRRTHPTTSASCSGERKRLGPDAPCRSASPANPSSL